MGEADSRQNLRLPAPGAQPINRTRLSCGVLAAKSWRKIRTRHGSRSKDGRNDDVMPRDVANRFFLYGLLLLAIPALACSGDARINDAPDWTPADSDAEVHPTRIVSPPSTGTLKTEAIEVSGEPVGIACATCHGTGEGTAESFAQRTTNARAKDSPRSMHTEVVLAHGDLVCASCHEAGSPDQLHIAAGESFSLEESMRLCSQCHGLIRTAYDNGAHGGMRGYWDLQRGPRERNNCIACHNPHSPAHPQVIPVAGPKDKRVYRRVHEGSIIDQRFGKDQHE